MLGKNLTKKEYNKITSNSQLSLLTLDELINIAIEFDKFWDYAGIYYKFVGKDKDNFSIIIDREQSVGGYNNSELVLSVVYDQIFSNDSEFKELVCKKIEEKSKAMEQQPII